MSVITLPDNGLINVTVFNIAADTSATTLGNSLYNMSASRTLTLPTPVGNAGLTIGLCNTGAHGSGILATVVTAAGTIDGQSSTVLPPKMAQYWSSDGTNWLTRSKTPPAQIPVNRTSAYTVLKEDLFNQNSILSTGTFPVTLLSASSVHAGDRVTIKNSGSGVITVATTSSQTIDGNATATLAVGQSATYQGDGSNWFTINATPVAGTTAGTFAAGNDSRLSDARTPTAHAATHESGGSDAIRLDQLAAPTNPVALNAQKVTGLANGTATTDAAAFGQIPTVPGSAPLKGNGSGALVAATLADILALSLGPPPAKSGQWQIASNTAGITATALSGTSGQATFCYVDIVRSMTLSKLGVHCPVAAVGGATLEFRLGWFADDGSLSYPGALIVDAGAQDLTATGTNGGSALTTVVQPGRYWIGCKWTFGTVPTTLPQVEMINPASPGLPGSNLGNNYRGYITTGLTSGAFSGSAPAGMAASGGTTVIAAGYRAT